MGIAAVQTWRRLVSQQAREAELSLATREAQLASLKAQLRPHFLFNTLNSIYSLVLTRPKQAQHMVALLADLLRKTLEMSDEALVSLRSEIEFVESYLGIERLRFEDRLHVRLEMSPDSAELLVPPLILQPLVENAVKHGISRLPDGGTIEVLAVKSGAILEVTVRDTGPGMPVNSGGERDGRGLEITRRRLSTIYGGRSALSIQNVAPHGCRARLRLPAVSSQEASVG